jgi:hypothetical protein
MNVPPQKFPTVHYAERGEDVKLLDWNETWKCAKDGAIRIVPSSLALEPFSCPECHGPMRKVRDNAQKTF